MTLNVKYNVDGEPCKITTEYGARRDTHIFRVENGVATLIDVRVRGDNSEDYALLDVALLAEAVEEVRPLPFIDSVNAPAARGYYE